MKEKISLLATSVGNLPHNNPGDAIDLIFKNFPNIPAWSQLPNVNKKEDAIIQFTQNIPGIIYDIDEERWFFDIDSESFYENLEEFFLDYESIVNDNQLDLLEKYEITEEYSSVLPLFLEKLTHTSPLLVKGQITGPFTWGTSLIDRDENFAFLDETLKEIIIKGLTLKALWQINQLKKHSPNSTPVIFIDEPSLSKIKEPRYQTIEQEGVIDAIYEISSIIKKNEALVGICCCGKIDWSLIIDCNVDIINFDSYLFAESTSEYSESIKTFLQKGGRIAWGIIPTHNEQSIQNATLDLMKEKFELAKTYLTSKGVNEDLIINSSLITQSCGENLLSYEEAEKAINLTQELSKSLKERYKSVIV